MKDVKVTNVRTDGGAPESEVQAPKAKLNSIEVTDEVGRKIVVKRLNPVEEMRLKKLAGTESSNPGYMWDLKIATSVVSIDGEPEPMASTVRQVEAMLLQLDHHGVEAVSKAVLELNGVDIDEEIARAKN